MLIMKLKLILAFKTKSTKNRYDSLLARVYQVFDTLFAIKTKNLSSLIAITYIIFSY